MGIAWFRKHLKETLDSVSRDMCRTIKLIECFLNWFSLTVWYTCSWVGTFFLIKVCNYHLNGCTPNYLLLFLVWSFTFMLPTIPYSTSLTLPHIHKRDLNLTSIIVIGYTRETIKLSVLPQHPNPIDIIHHDIEFLAGMACLYFISNGVYPCYKR